MQPHKPTEQIAERIKHLGLAVMTWLVAGCMPPGPPGLEADSQPEPDLPPETTEFEGILQGIDYHTMPSRFYECETEELFEISYGPWPDGNVLMGACDGVYNRVRGRLDRSFDPPRLFVDETLEARWSEPDDCSFPSNPWYESCHLETEQPVISICEPAGPACDGSYKCQPVRFDATEFAGWKHHECLGSIGDGVAGDPCEYPDGGDLDTCAQGSRCWNADGDLTAPGVCVPYCDLTGQLGPACEGTCVRCSSSVEHGLCMTECSGDDCNVDAFC